MLKVCLLPNIFSYIKKFQFFITKLKNLVCAGSQNHYMDFHEIYNTGVSGPLVVYHVFFLKSDCQI